MLQNDEAAANPRGGGIALPVTPPLYTAFRTCLGGLRAWRIRMHLNRVLLLFLVAALALPLLARDRQAARRAYQTAHGFHERLRQKTPDRRTVGDYERAIYLYRRVVDHDPTYGACDDALFSMAFLYEEGSVRFKKSSWTKEAIRFYEFLAREYPLTPHRDEAVRRSARLRAPPPKPAKPPTKAEPGSDRTVVTEIRYWSSQDYTRLVIQLEREVQFEKKVLSDPDRIYFDLLETRLENELERAYDVNGVFLKRVRVGENRPGVVRVVLDFETIHSHSVFALYDPYRIVIDTRGGKSAEGDAPAETIKTAEAVISLEDDGPSTRSVVVERPATPSRDGGLTLTRTLGLKVGRIAIDPGHGGRDTGSVGTGGLTEKDLVLDVALQLKELLEERLGTEVVLTREEDVFVPLEERTAVANQEGADLFISIHANSSRHRKVSGVETFYLHYASDDEALEVASRENAGSQRNIRELEDLLRKIALGDYNRESRDLAHTIQDKLQGTMREFRPAWKNRGVKKAPFIVLINSEMPSVLTEIGFISNPADEKYLKKEPAREQIAEALYKGIEEYLRAIGSAPGDDKTATSNN